MDGLGLLQHLRCKNTLGNNIDRLPELKFMMQYSAKYRHVNFEKTTPEVWRYVFG